MPRGKRNTPSAAPAKAAMQKLTVELPTDIAARVQRGAAADERPTGIFLRRFITANIDLLDPEGQSDASTH